ncbi:Major royal jelly protein [Actinacidiphila yanglinensis]|uniref:Major royal jelly protein n=1 Tax=Actinacidiphila yanglinensis TaxID=310779 RepID=A0A1H6CJG5_9ACTN|nr:L-dopachrome tautomerase-related protein [Actinacidiphila yanglinensis]SEG72546.1 Major royal jelly protein [Actinacidiphila yanglinensis]
MEFTRRRFLSAASTVAVGAAGAVTMSGCGSDKKPAAASRSDAKDPELKLTVAARSPWMANQVALTRANTLFLGLPRFPGHETTPSVARRESDGSVAAFPGNTWNQWKAGDDGRNAFVYVNSVHIFADDTVWCVDQGGLRADSAPKELSTPKPGAQKIVQFDPRSGEALQVLRFGDDILPPGAQMNDLRIHGTTMYVTDSGLGALIVHDLSTGKTTRRLSGYKEMLGVTAPAPATAAPGKTQSKHKTPKSDMIELTRDGKWLYWAAPTGPFYRVATDVLRDTSVSDAQLATHVQHVADIPLSGGCAMDTLGNLYLSDIDNKRIVLMPPSGRKTVLAANTGLVSPDGSFLSAERRLYVPAPQTERTQLFGNPKDLTEKPFLIYSLPLPGEFDGVQLGNAVTGQS